MLQDELREIRSQLRRAMNGVVAASMREKGIRYHLNFGVPLLEIKQIAATHTPGSELAAALWKEDVREYKILASLLQPVADFPLTQAAQWVREIPYPEIAEQCSRNLFCRLPYVDEFVSDLLLHPKGEYARTVAFLVLAELFRNGSAVTAPVQAFFLEESLRTVTRSEAGVLWKEKQAAVQAMKFYGRRSAGDAKRIMSGFDVFPEFMKTQEGQEVYTDLKFEFEYYTP